jgi:hypothetical protein
MWQYQNTDELYHHGILGMKWGVRKETYNKESSNISNMDKAKLINERYYRKLDRLRRNSRIVSNSMAGVSGLCLGGAIFVSGLLPLAGGLALGSVAVNQFSKLGEFFIDKKRVDTVLPYEISSITDMIEKIT